MASIRRKDWYHMVYQLTAGTGEGYIVVSFVRGDSRSMKARKKSVEARFGCHVRNALQYGHNTLLSEAIRDHGPNAFERVTLHVIRGKQETHDMERDLIASIQPELNMEGMGRKITSKKDS